MTALAVALLVIVVGGVWVLLVWLGFRALRRGALGIEHSSASIEDRVHRLRRLSLAALGGWLLIVVAGIGITAGLASGRHRSGHHHGNPLVALAAVLFSMFVLVLPILAISRAIRPCVARLRDVPLKAQNRWRMGLVSGVGAAIIVTGFNVGRGLVPAHGAGHAVGVAAVYFVVLVVAQLVLAPALVLALRTRPLDDATRTRLQRLASAMHVRVRDVRVYPGAQQKSANAVQLGIVPPFRYVLVSDYLLDNLPAGQVDAVVAHEYGHVRGRHLLVKLLAVLATFAVLEAMAAGVSAVAGTSLIVILTVPLILAWPVGLVVVQGLVGVRLEERADDAAARAVGHDELAGALDAIGRLNHAKRDTGRGWALLTQHPGLAVRIRRLHGDTAAGVPSPR